MTHLRERNLPRIVLLDCADEVVASLQAANYDVVVGYTGYFVEHSQMDIPSALHERDLLVIDLDPGWTPRGVEELYPGADNFQRGDHAREPRHKGAPLERFTESLARGGAIICLVEGVTRPRIGPYPLRGEGFEWLPGGREVMGRQQEPVTTSEVSDDRYLQVPQSVVEEAPGLGRLLSSPVQEVRSLRTLRGVTALLLNESGHAKAGLFQSILLGAIGGPVFLLPYFKRKPAALHTLLTDVLPQINSDLFPPRDRTWASDRDDYQMPAVLRARHRREELVKAHDEAMAELDAEEQSAVLASRPFTALLTAHGEDLHPLVRDALDWLGFEVRDLDAEKKAAGERLVEDLQVKDGDYFAVIEVTSSKGNAKDKDFADLTKYQRWRSQAPERDDVDGRDVRGMMVMNQHYLDEPSKRAPLYATSRDVDWPQQAGDTGITLVSTWELFKLLRAVSAGTLEREQARRLLEQPGLYSFAEDKPTPP